MRGKLCENLCSCPYWVYERLGECAIQGGVLIPEDPETELYVCDLKWAEINLKLQHFVLQGPEIRQNYLTKVDSVITWVYLHDYDI